MCLLFNVPKCFDCPREKTAETLSSTDNPLSAAKPRRGRRPKVPKTNPTNINKKLTFKVERHLWESLERWGKVYQLIEGTTSTPAQVARRFLRYALNDLQAKVKSGEIDFSEVNCPLP